MSETFPTSKEEKNTFAYDEKRRNVFKKKQKAFGSNKVAYNLKKIVNELSWKENFKMSRVRF